MPTEWQLQTKSGKHCHSVAIVLKMWQTCPQSGNYNQNVAINPQRGNNTQNVANMIIVMPNVDSF